MTLASLLRVLYHLSGVHQNEWMTHIDIKNIQLHAGCYLIDSTEGRHVDSLPPDGTCTANTGGILPGPAVDDGIDQNLEGILAAKVNIFSLFSQRKAN